ncbi:MAG: hypothetical protein Q9218_005982 [Villophora microphyllina]
MRGLLALLCMIIVGTRAAIQEYIIYPLPALDWTSISAVHSFIIRLAGEAGDSSKIKDVELNDIAGAFLDSPLRPDNTLQATPAYETQSTPAATELRMISQPSGEANLNKYKNYVYPANAGEGSFIYHLEMGINPHHDEFAHRHGEWVFTGLAIRAGQHTRDEAQYSKGHSTCTASKASGNLYGAAKHATLVVVKMPDLSRASMLEILHTVLYHIQRNRRRGRAVLTISWGSIKSYADGAEVDAWAQAMNEVILKLDVENVIIVCAAGNYANQGGKPGFRNFVDTIPALFTYSIVPAPLLIAVGNCDLSGRKYFDSQRLYRDLTQMHAPGVGVRCADALYSSSSHLATGTSYSAPLVAGVIAGFLPLLNTMSLSGKQAFLRRQLSWRRPNGGECVIWNRIDESHNPPFLTANNTGGFMDLAESSTNSSAADWPDTTLYQALHGTNETAVA